MTKLLETFGTSVSFVAERKSYTASLSVRSRSLCPAKNSRDVGVKLPKGVLQQVEELEEGIIKEEILPAFSSDIASRLNPI